VTQRYGRDSRGNAWVDTDGSGNVNIRRLFGDATAQLIAAVKPTGATQIAWYLTDRLGSVRLVAAMVSGNLTTLATYNYDAYGNLLSSSSGYFDRFQWTGQERDPNTGEQLNGNRWYDAPTGRWDELDPIRIQSGDANYYRYGGDDPTNVTDPSGDYAWILGGLAVAAGGWLLQTVGDAFLPKEWAEWTHAAGDIAIAGGLAVASGPLAAGALGFASGLFGTTVATALGTTLLGLGLGDTVKRGWDAYWQGQQEGWSAARYVDVYGSLGASWLGPLGAGRFRGYRNSLEGWFNGGQQNGAALGNWFNNNLLPPAPLPAFEMVGNGGGGAAALQGGPGGGMPWFSTTIVGTTASSGNGPSRSRTRIGTPEEERRYVQRWDEIFGGQNGENGAPGGPNPLEGRPGAELKTFADGRMFWVDKDGNIVPPNAPVTTGGRIRNQHLAGQNHPRTGVPFDSDGFPVFDSVFDATIPESLQGPAITDSQQFKDATQQLNQALQQNPALRQNFTQAQLDAIAQGVEKIPGYTWHHHQNGETLELVDSTTHSRTGHSGGRQMTGGRP
jgi:RHS repeat-associated protein